MVMDRETAATVLQAHYRGRLGRKVYLDKLIHQFEKDEALRKNKELLQVAEGDLLVNRYRLQREICDWETLSINKLRQLDAMATRIQRAWRVYTTAKRNINRHHTAVRPSQDTYYYADTAIVNSNGTDVEQSHDLEFDVSNNDAELEELVANALPNSHISHPYFEPHHLRDLEVNVTVKENTGKPKTEFGGDDGRSLLKSQDLSLENQKHDTSGHHYLHSYRPSDETEQMEISHVINSSTVFERRSSQFKNDASLSELHLDYKLNQRFSPTSHASHHIQTSQNKYRLCFTSDISDSSSEEQDQDVYNGDLFHRGMSELPVPVREHTHTDISENAHPIGKPHISHVNITTPETVPRLGLNETVIQDTRVEQDWHKSTSLSDGLSFSEDFGNMDYPFHKNILGVDSLSDSLSNNEHVSNACSVHPLNVNREGHICHPIIGTQSHQKLDHSSSPLHTMSVVDLRNLHQLLKSRMKGTSKVLVELLVQREKLASENSLLQANIAQLARNTQSLYTRSTTLLPSH